MAGKQSADLGDVQQTLFIPLAARAAQTRRKHPALRDHKAVEILEAVDVDALYAAHPGGFVTIARTLMFDWWVREFLAAHPGGTVVELGTGLNTRFERVDNGQCHWIDLDLPDTIEVRRRFFADTDRRQMVAASVLDDSWQEVAAACPAPYFFVSDGVLVYLPQDEVKSALGRIATRFGGSLLAFDTYGRPTYERQHALAAKRGMAARWAWWCDDPRTLEDAGLRVIDSRPFTRPQAGLRKELPARYRWLLPLTDPVLRTACTLTLFRAG
ncbi:MAG TPA: class I SAM-dependent methyltransferase [Trebonia sp.]|nr:class I SAM-dependent methyltransferase [Trebonia sp.]